MDLIVGMSAGVQGRRCSCRFGWEGGEKGGDSWFGVDWWMEDIGMGVWELVWLNWLKSRRRYFASWTHCRVRKFYVRRLGI